MTNINLPQRNGTWLMMGISGFTLLISLKWIFFVQDLSQFLIYAITAGICLVLAFLLEKQGNIHNKQINLEARLDSMVYPGK